MDEPVSIQYFTGILKNVRFSRYNGDYVCKYQVDYDSEDDQCHNRFCWMSRQ